MAGYSKNTISKIIIDNAINAINAENASIASTAISSSYALTASYALNSPTSSNGPYSGSFTGSFTGSFIGDGSGLTGIVASATPGGPNKSVQFNDAGTTSGSSNFTFDKVTNNVELTGSILITGSIEGVDYIDFSTDYIIGTNEPVWKEGRLFYDSGSGALAFYNWEQEVTLNIGQEQWLRARNDSGQVVPNGTPVRVTGAAGDKPNFDLAQAVDQVGTFSIANDIIGVTTQEIGIGETGFITTFGIVNGLDTQTPGWSAGDILWVSQSAGELTSVAPQAPYDKIFVGIVTRVNPNNGSIFVRCEPPIHFHDISSVSASAYTYGDLWMFKATGSSGVWTNTKTLSGSYTLSGSLTTNDGASVQSLTASFVSASSITGSLFGTSSWAYSSSQALTASYVNLLAGPNITINYEPNGIAITGSGGGGTPGGVSSNIQFNYDGVFDGSNNFTFDKGTNHVSLTGSLTISGSTSYINDLTATGSFTGSFYGELLGSSSYATTASYAETTPGPKIYVSTTEPVSPNPNDIWIKY